MKHYAQEQIITHVPLQSKVLDLGCGDGALLLKLNKIKKIKGYGIDILIENIVKCTEQGISVYHGDLNEGLPGFATHSYDIVILSQTLQQIEDPKMVLEEMLRVGQQGIVTFPNFAYWKVRLNLFLKGSAPKTKHLPYEWYNTPNIRVLSIADFKQLCHKLGIKIVKEIPIYTTSVQRQLFPKCLTNLFAPEGMFVIEKTASL